MENNSFWYKINTKLTFLSLIPLAVGIFTSISIMALHHIFFIMPCLYFSYLHFKKNSWKGFNFFSPSQWALLGFSFFIFISILVNWKIMFEPVLKRILVLKYFLLPLFGYFAYEEAFKNYIDLKKRKFLIHLFLLTATVASVSGLIGIQLGFNPITFYKPIMAAGRNNGLTAIMDYGYGMSLLLILISGALIYRDKINDYISTRWLLFYWITNFVGLIFSYARGAWMGFFLAFPFLFWNKGKKVFSVILILSILIPILLIKEDSLAKDRFLHSDQSNNERIAHFTSAVLAFKEKPIFGWGFGNFAPHSIEIKKKYNIAFPDDRGNAYNSFMESLVSTGIFGFIFYSLFTFFWAWEGKKMGTPFGLVISVFVFSYLISAQVQYTMGDSENLFLIMGVYGLSKVLVLEKKPLET